MGRAADEKLAPGKIDTSAIDWDARVAGAHAIIDEAIELYKPTHVFGMLSGGHDSLCTALVAASHPAFTAMVHINTGIGIDETRQFVRDTCERKGWPLLEYHPPVSYRDIVLQHGFPGPGGHFFAYTRLKERAMRQLTREHKVKRMDKIMLITGVRSQESVRRMRHVDTIQKEGARIWVAPIHDWAKAECAAFIELKGMPRNQVVDTMHMSGECMCGSFSKPGEMQDLELWYPKLAAEIHALEEEVKAKGIAACVWGQRPPKMTAAEAARQRIDLSLPMCTSCATDRLLAGSEEDEPEAEEESTCAPDAACAPAETGCGAGCACAPAEGQKS